ncbi:MAG: hypothetical protein E4H14_19850 [Candidatus Thorarchaeota archaeon]|nr:MAG: hypothetical protein E4H14_19850 [Candidatus Thorarchaeota archaeon]
MSDTFQVSAVHGDVLAITAKCVESGLVHDYITVIDPNHTDTTTDPTDSTTTGPFTPSTDMYIAIAIVAGIICVIVACIMYCAEKIT